jgi:hypothetical protein
LNHSKLMQESRGINADIRRERPGQAKPKGRKMTETEKQSATLGAKGPKLGTRRCHECGKYTTHNARTCPTLPHNQKRLEALRSKRGPGRPPGAANKSKIARQMDDSEGHSERPRARESVTPSRLGDELGRGSEDQDDMDIDC